METDPNAFYQAARDASESDPEVMARARARALALQERDPETVRLWTYLVDLAKHYFNGIYAALDITLTDADLAGAVSYTHLDVYKRQEMDTSFTLDEGNVPHRLAGTQ